MEKQPTCEERIGAQLASAMEDIRNALADVEGNGARQEYGESILYFGKIFEVYRVELSYGGPQDYIDLFVDPEDRVIDHAIYHFLDWFDSAQRPIVGDDLEAVREMFEPWIEYA